MTLQSKGFKSTIKPLTGKKPQSLDLNDGDAELSPFLDPLLNHSGVP